VNTPESIGIDAFKIPFLIGVVGHRDLVESQLPEIRTALMTQLLRLKTAHPGVPLKLLCSMADGADLLTAQIAVELEISTIALLPYARTICRADLITEAARAQFDAICERSEIVELSLPSSVDEAQLLDSKDLRDGQLQHAAALIARYSGLLLVIWDGLGTNHRAGTARTVELRRMGNISADELTSVPYGALLSAHGDDVNFEIRCARLSTGSHGRVQVLGFTGSQIPRSDDCPRVLQTTLIRIAEFNREIDEFGAQIAREGRRLSQPSPYEIPVQLLYLDRLFTAADWMGSYFRGTFTRALKARYILWAVMAFLLITFKKESVGPVALASIIAVLSVFLLGTLLAVWAHRRGWHRKYLDYRALAEALRVDFYWEVSGVRKEFEGQFAHDSFLQRQDVDLNWIRNAMRAVSLQLAISPSHSIAHGFPFAYAAWVGDDDPVNGSGQMHYYRQRLGTLQRKLHHAEHIDRGLLFAGLALAVIFAVDVGLRLWDRQLLAQQIRGWLLWALALLPVYAAIFEIYLNEKADRALVRQYRYMYSLFGIAARVLRESNTEERKLSILRSLGHACLAEHAQWILAHRDKRIQGMRW
jgi:hypothetical protein